MSDREIQGWYYRNATSEAVRVRLSAADQSLLLHTLSGRLVASWSLDRLKNREIAILGERWSIGDDHLPDAYIVLESNEEYRWLRGLAKQLRPVRARLWRQLGFSVIESGNLTGLPLLLIFLAVSAAAALWHLL